MGRTGLSAGHTKYDQRRGIFLMVGIGVLITKYISLNPQPGIVECQLFDAYGNEWTFQDKTAIFASHSLDTDSDYPLPGAIACEVIKQWQDTNGREIVSI